MKLLGKLVFNYLFYWNRLVFFAVMESWFLIIGVILAALYSGLIWLYRFWFNRLKPFEPIPKALQTPVFFSVIVPARNESEAIEACLNSILAQQYPVDSYEIIVVDDFSTDDTAAIVRSLSLKFPHLQLISLQDFYPDGNQLAYKKKAIELAISKSKGTWVVTTDADCIVPPLWLHHFSAMIAKENPVFIAAPVMFTYNGKFSGIFQLLDFMSLQGITAAAVSAGSHTMCNGANLAYSKQAFEQVGGFRGIDHLASGDDMLLMYKMKREFGKRLSYLFSSKSIVLTAPMPGWKQFLHQRIRWASKASYYEDKGMLMVLWLVYLLNAILLVGLIASFFYPVLFPHVLLLIAIKTIAELGFLLPVAHFFQLKKWLLYFPLMQPFHIVYTVIAGWLGKFGSYQWKSRKVQ